MCLFWVRRLLFHVCVCVVLHSHTQLHTIDVAGSTKTGLTTGGTLSVIMNVALIVCCTSVHLQLAECARAQAVRETGRNGAQQRRRREDLLQPASVRPAYVQFKFDRIRVYTNTHAVGDSPLKTHAHTHRQCVLSRIGQILKIPGDCARVFVRARNRKSICVHM